MDTLLQNLRNAARALLRGSGFPVALLLVLALMIGTNAYLFGGVASILLQPHEGAGTGTQLVSATLPAAEGRRTVMSSPDFLDYQVATGVYRTEAASADVASQCSLSPAHERSTPPHKPGAV